jgi:hypothetical protein
MSDYASAVLRTLEEASRDDLAYVRAQLSEDYDPLFEHPARASVASRFLVFLSLGHRCENLL